MNRTIKTPLAYGRIYSTVAAIALAATLTAGFPAEPANAEQGAPNSAQLKRHAQMKSKGSDASLTVLSIPLAGQPNERITELVGLMLEQHGLKHIELGAKAFQTTPGIDLQQLSAGVGEFVRQNPIRTDYAVYSEFNGSLEKRQLESIRAVVVDKQGDVVWSYEMSSQDEALRQFQTHPDLMLVTTSLAQQLGLQLGLNEQTTRDAKPGNMARLMAQRSGLPPQEELKALPAREAKLREERQTLTMLVIPPRVNEQASSVDRAAALAKKINEADLCKAVSATEAVQFKAAQGDPNEMKVLWDLAREFREYVRKNTPQEDYALCADYVFTANHWKQGYVHVVVCDRQGEWVLVDLQNSHQSDYQGIRPTSKQDCDRLLVERLEKHLNTTSRQ